jgi:hypothetical protein
MKLVFQIAAGVTLAFFLSLGILGGSWMIYQHYTQSAVPGRIDK